MFYFNIFLYTELPNIRPLVVSIWCGPTKPNNLTEFLKPFVNELKEVLRYGITENGHHINISIRCFLCDTPARSFLKGIVSFNHKYGCQKCLTKGVFYKKANRMSFTEIDAELRTDNNFRNPNANNEAEVLHHKEFSILEELPINMIDSFVVSDPLHLIELGIMKKYVLV